MDIIKTIGDVLGFFNDPITASITTGVVGLFLGKALDKYLFGIWLKFATKKKKEQMFLKYVVMLNNFLEQEKKTKPETFGRIEKDIIEVLENSVRILKS